MCIFYFDMGNTHTKIALAQKDQPFTVYSLPTTERYTPDQIGFSLLDILRHNNLQANNIIACVGASVVPGMTNCVREACQKYLAQPLLLAPEDIPIPLKNNYKRPHETGADLLIGAYAARRLFPDTTSFVIVDYGTATTFACVTDATFLGGLICPGVLSSLNSLASNTAKLPKISLEITSTEPEIGISTTTCLNHGFVFGFASLTEGVCARLTKNLAKPVKIIGTGGFSKAMTQVTTCFDNIEPNLLFTGLQFLYTEHIRS